MKAIAFLIAGATAGALILARMERRYMVDTLIGGTIGTRDVLVMEPLETDATSYTIEWGRHHA